MDSPLTLLDPIIRQSNATLCVNPDDHKDDEGILICGTCGEPKQTLLKVSADTPPIKVHCVCRCERKAMKRNGDELKRQQDMEYISTLKSVSLMDGRMRDASFDKFIETKFNSRNLKLCRRYAENFDEMLGKNQGLLFWGNAGTGKSFAAACIANYLLNRKVPVMMTSILKMTDLIMNIEEQESRIISRLNKAKLVIFDDFGTERTTEYVSERAYSIIDSRYRSKLPMIVTTNLTLTEMEREASMKYGRLYDRILENCYPMQFGGNSWRRKEAAKRYDEMEAFLNES